MDPVPPPLLRQSKRASSTVTRVVARAFVRSPVAAFVFAAGCVVALVVFLSLSLYRESEARAVASASNVANLIETHVEGMLRRVAENLNETAADVRPEDLVDDRFAAAQSHVRHAMLARHMDRHLAAFPELRWLVIHDAQGGWRYAGASAGAPEVPDAAWAGLLVPSADESPRFSGPIALADAQPVMVVARAVHAPDDAVIGYVSAVIDLGHFQRLLDRMNLGEHGITAINRMDGSGLVRSPAYHQHGSGNVPQVIFDMIRSGVSEGQLTVASPLDHLERRVSYRRLHGYPFFVGTGVAEADYLADWRRVTWTACILAALLIAVGGAYVMLMGSASRRAVAHMRDTAGRELRFRTALATMREGLFVVEGRPPVVTVANQAMYDMASASPGSLEGTLLSDVPAELRRPDGTPLARAEQPVRRVLEVGLSTDNETYRLRRPGHDDIWVSVSAHPLAFAAGRVDSVLVTFSDITAERRTLDALRDSEARLQGIVDSAMDGVIGVDADHRIRHFNRAAEQIFGYAAADVIGGPLQILIPEHARAAHTAGFDRFAASEIRQLRAEEMGIVEARRADGTCFPAEVTIARLEENGAPLFVVILRDATTRVAAEQALKDANAALDRRVRTRTVELEQANRELESFSYSVSHDLRAPLRAIHGFASLLRDHLGRDVDGDTRHFLGRIVGGTEKMGQLIDDVLRYSRVTRLEVARVDVDLDRLAADVAAELREEYPRAAIVIEPLGRTRGDPGMLRQIFVNLVGNACKYSSDHEAPQVRIAAERRGERVTYVVRDNGVGFSMEHAANLFGMFQRLHNDSRYPGTGVGLALVKRLVERHGGRIVAQAEEGCGAEFRFTLDGSDPAA